MKSNSDGEASPVIGPNARMHALARIRGLGLPLDEPLVAHYPAMKLGGFAAVAFFADLISERVQSVMDGRDPGGRKVWLITSPPFFHLPSAANLLAERVYEILQRRRTHRVEFTELRLKAAARQHVGEQSVRRTLDYSRSSQRDRAIERQAVLARIETEGLSARLAGREVLFINDINVTGTQQASLEEVLSPLGVRESDWFYIFDVERALAQAHPELEHRINTFPRQDRENWISLMNQAGTRPTARCLSRLLLTGMEEFASLLSELQPAVLRSLHTLAVAEGRFEAPEFDGKMALLARHSSPRSHVQTVPA